MFEHEIAVSFDDEALYVRYPGRAPLTVKWGALTRVGIRTTGEGPFAPDVLWGFHTGEDTPAAVFASGAAGEKELLAELQRRLPGFDNARFIDAMGCAGEAFFLLWQR